MRPLLCLLVGFLGFNASAQRLFQPIALSDSERELAARQEALVRQADRLTERVTASRPLPIRDGDAPGFGAIEIDNATHCVKLFWKSGTPIPLDVERFVASTVGAPEPVLVFSSKYDQAELLSEMKSLADDVAKTGGLELVELGPLRGAAGLSVVVDNELSDAENHSALHHTRARLERFGSSGVVLSRGKRPRTTSRVADYPPYWGGSRIQVGATTCSTAFAYYLPLMSISIPGVLTSGHCTLGNGYPVKNGANQVIGTSTGFLPVSNTQFIDRAGITVTASMNAIYTGDVGVNEIGMFVKGQGVPYVGTSLCTSGSYSGTRCGVTVLQRDTWVYSVEGWQMVGQAIAEQFAHQNAAGLGDSGGPVFMLINNGADARAMGVLSTGGSESQLAECTNVRVIDGLARKCFYHVSFVTIDAALNGLGVLKTN